jgi:hypothetical protein
MLHLGVSGLAPVKCFFIHYVFLVALKVSVDERRGEKQYRRNKKITVEKYRIRGGK